MSEGGYFEVRRKGMRYVASTRETALKSSLPPPKGQWVEKPGSQWTKDCDRLKRMAVRAADGAIPGISKAKWAVATRRAKRAFGRQKSKEEIGYVTVDNAADFLHYFFNVCGFGYAAERAIAMEHLRIINEGRRPR